MSGRQGMFSFKHHSSECESWWLGGKGKSCLWEVGCILIHRFSQAFEGMSSISHHDTRWSDSQPRINTSTLPIFPRNPSITHQTMILIWLSTNRHPRRRRKRSKSHHLRVWSRDWSCRDDDDIAFKERQYVIPPPMHRAQLIGQEEGEGRARGFEEDWYVLFLQTFVSAVHHRHACCVWCRSRDGDGLMVEESWLLAAKGGPMGGGGIKKWAILFHNDTLFCIDDIGPARSNSTDWVRTGQMRWPGECLLSLYACLMCTPSLILPNLPCGLYCNICFCIQSCLVD